MAKKRGGIAGGIKTVYHVHRALEAVQSVTASKIREFVEGLKEITLMSAALVAVVGVFWLVTSAISLLKKAIM